MTVRVYKGPVHMTSRSTLAIALGIGVALVAASCGGGSTGTATNSTASRPVESEIATTETPVATTAPAGAPIATEAPPETNAPTTTVAPLEPESFDLATIPDLVAEIDATVGDASLDPLAVAQGLFGFPFDITVPDGSSLLSARAGLGFVTDDAHPYEFAYTAIADGGVVPDIDITLDDSGPGSLALIDFFDPRLAELGFDRANSTGSDPGDPGGPHSINHVYVTEQEERDFNGVLGIIQPLFIWVEEDTNGWAYNDTLPEFGGWRVDVEGDFPTDASTTPIPVANAIIEQLVLPGGLTLSDVGVSLRTRDADSFSIDLGETYTDIYLEWTAPADQLDAIVEHFSDIGALFPDEAVFMAGEDDFFDEGTIVRSELRDFGDASKRLDVLLLQRYGGTLGIDASDDGTEPMTVYLDLELNPAATELTLPTE